MVWTFQRTIHLPNFKTASRVNNKKNNCPKNSLGWMLLIFIKCTVKQYLRSDSLPYSQVMRTRTFRFNFQKY